MTVFTQVMPYFIQSENNTIKLSWTCKKFNWFQSGSIFAAGKWRVIFRRLERDQVVIMATWNDTSCKTSWHHWTSRQLKFAFNWALLPCGFRCDQRVVMQLPNFHIFLFLFLIFFNLGYCHSLTLFSFYSIPLNWSISALIISPVSVLSLWPFIIYSDWILMGYKSTSPLKALRTRLLGFLQTVICIMS